MKLGMRTPSLKKKLSSKTSAKRIIRHNMGIKAPKGTGIIRDPKKAIYNKVYNKTTFSAFGSSSENSKTKYSQEDYEYNDNFIQPNDLKLYEKTWFVILSLVLFWPLGLFLTWKSRGIHPQGKLILTVASLLFMGISLSN